MIRNSAIPPESFEEILAWLNPDREVAATMYVQLRHDLAKLFSYKGCADPEGLTDEVFDRVRKKIHNVRPVYDGDPRAYFRAVANNLVKENLKKDRNQVSLEGIDLPQQKTTETEESIDIEECLQTCLLKLTDNKRKLLVAYYAKEKQAKIDHRSELAQQLGITVEALRVKIYRTRLSLQECIEDCLKRKAGRK